MDASYAYEFIDRYLRNNLGDDDYAEYSEALEAIASGKTKSEYKPYELSNIQI